MIIFGMDVFSRKEDSIFIKKMKERLINKYPQIIQRNENEKQKVTWNGINYLQTRASRNGGLDLGFVPGPDVTGKENIKLVYLYGVDYEFDIENQISNDAFVIYQGSHGDIGASRHCSHSMG